MSVGARGQRGGFLPVFCSDRLNCTSIHAKNACLSQRKMIGLPVDNILCSLEHNAQNGGKQPISAGWCYTFFEGVTGHPKRCNTFLYNEIRILFALVTPLHLLHRFENKGEKEDGK